MSYFRSWHLKCSSWGNNYEIREILDFFLVMNLDKMSCFQINKDKVFTKYDCRGSSAGSVDFCILSQSKYHHNFLFSWCHLPKQGSAWFEGQKVVHCFAEDSGKPLPSTCTHTYIYPVYNPDTLMPRCFLCPQCHCWRIWNTPTSWPCTTSSTLNAASHWSLSILWVLWQNAQQRISNTPWPLNTVACLDRTATSNSTWTTAEIWWACTTWRWATS